MKRFDKSELAAINRLTSGGASLKSIARQLGLSKTAVYYHFLKIRGRTYSEPVFSFPSEEALGEVLGIFAGDGSLCFDPVGYHYVVKVHCGIDLRYAEYVRQLFSECFGKQFSICGPRNNLLVESVCRPIYNFFCTNLAFGPPRKAHTVRLPSIEHPEEFLVGFLRGLIDTDGHVNPRTKAIVFYTVSTKLALQASKIASKLGFEHSVGFTPRKRLGYKDLHYVRFLSATRKEFVYKIRPFKWTGRDLNP